MRAFTIVEILVSSVVLLIIVSGIFMVFNAADKAFYLDSGVLELQQNARQAMYTMIKELHQAQTASKSISSGGAKIIFNTPLLSGIQYYRDTAKNQVIREYPTGTLQVLANYVTGLTFCCWNSGTCDTNCTGSELVEIQLDAANTVRARPVSFSVKERVKTRNE